MKKIFVEIEHWSLKMECKFCGKEVPAKIKKGGMPKVFCSRKCTTNFSNMQYLKRIYRGDKNGNK